MSGSPIKTWSTPVAEEEQAFVPCALCTGLSFNPFFNCDGFAYVKCVVCGLVQINPQPCPEHVYRRYQELYGSDYCSYEMDNEAAFLELQKHALKDARFFQLEKKIMAGKEGPPAILDVGCATGALLAFFQERGWQVAGVEISPSAEYAQARLGQKISRMDLQNSHFSDESFDLVHASHLIEHLNNPQAFLSEVWRILRPDAYFMLTTPNIDGVQARMFKSRWRSAIFDHLYLFSARTLKAMLRESGFSIEGIYTWGGLAAGIAPLPVKRLADKMVKIFGIGDVMLVNAKKKDYNISSGDK